MDDLPRQLSTVLMDARAWKHGIPAAVDADDDARFPGD
jgi:hypothetical protein